MERSSSQRWVSVGLGTMTSLRVFLLILVWVTHALCLGRRFLPRSIISSSFHRRAPMYLVGENIDVESEEFAQHISRHPSFSPKDDSVSPGSRGSDDSFISDNIIETIDDLKLQLNFLKQAALVGFFTAVGIVIFKLSIQETSKILYENLADVLPKPAGFYWPQILFPVLGSVIVSILTYYRGLNIRRGVDKIAQSLDYDGNAATSNAQELLRYNPFDQLFRISAAVATLGSGCSLGPEGPAVEIGAGLSCIFGSSGSPWQKRHLFLAGTAAGVSAGFNAPIAGVFFALECGKRFLKVNTMTLSAESKDGPRADVAAIVLAATVAKVVVEFGLSDSNALAIQGNIFAMQSPLFELPLYLGLGVFAGIISTIFTRMLDYFTSVFGPSNVNAIGENSLKRVVSQIPLHLRPLFGGLLCGIVALYYPQTVFVGYATLDQLLAGKIHLPLLVLIQLLGLKVILSSFSLGTGLVGGVFAPSLFFGAVAGTIYHDVICNVFTAINNSVESLGGADLMPFFSIASAPAYATVGAAATLGALFRAPLTSTILMLELTENHEIVIPVLISSGLSGFLAEILRGRKK